MARRVADVALMFDVIAGFDSKDSTSLQDRAEPTFGGLGRGVEGLRIGVDREYALAGIDAGQAASIEEALKVLSSLGAHIVDVRMPDMTGIPEAWFLLCEVRVPSVAGSSCPVSAGDVLNHAA